MPTPISLTRHEARRIWMRAQGLDRAAPFGGGADATRRAVEHLGYVQIDTINVIERCHHHILWSRIPEYRRAHLQQAQSTDKSVFEYWTHALAYVPTRDLRFFIDDMRRRRAVPGSWFDSVAPEEVRKLLGRIRVEGALSIRDIEDDVLVEKDHAWASRKPSKRALQLAFLSGQLTISAREGMVKRYELIGRHFGWDSPPRPVPAARKLDYLLDRALRAQGIVSLDSACHLDASRKAGLRERIEERVARGRLVPVSVAGAERVGHWACPAMLAAARVEEFAGEDTVHILSPFDPLVIQRKRLELMFGYTHRFEAYVPKTKRVFGYFALPVLVGDRVVAAIDLKADRARNMLQVQQWNWIGPQQATHSRLIEDSLHRFEQFQFET